MLAYYKVVAPGLVYLMPFHPVDPGFGVPGGPVDPGFGVDAGGHPDQGLPGSPGHPSTGPVWPGGRPVDPGYGVGVGRPDNSLPAIPGVPDNSLPTTPPPAVAAGQILVIVRSADGKWKWATVSSPPTTLPEPPPVATPKA